MKSKLKTRQVKECLLREPTISSLEEMCAVLNVDRSKLHKDEAAAAIKLIEKLGGEVTKCVFLLELAGLNGRDKLKGYDVETVVSYEGK